MASFFEGRQGKIHAGIEDLVDEHQSRGSCNVADVMQTFFQTESDQSLTGCPYFRSPPRYCHAKSQHHHESSSQPSDFFVLRQTCMLVATSHHEPRARPKSVSRTVRDPTKSSKSKSPKVPVLITPRDIHSRRPHTTYRTFGPTASETPLYFTSYPPTLIPTDLNPLSEPGKKPP